MTAATGSRGEVDLSVSIVCLFLCFLNSFREHQPLREHVGLLHPTHVEDDWTTMGGFLMSDFCK